MASVLASFGIELKKRIAGAITGLIAVAVFNIARIVLSVLIISWFGLDAGNFSHDVLFKLFLIVTIAGFYYLWFYWATGRTQFSRLL